MNTISICLYVRNNQELINQWLDTFLNSTVSSIELVIVDDGSTDETLLHIQSFSLHYKGKIKLIMTPSVGFLSAINKAMGFMHGDFYCFLNIYDILHNDYLEKLPSLLNTSMKAYAIYPILEEERVITKQTALCFLPNISSYLFHKEIINQVKDKGLENPILFDVLYQLMQLVEEVICLPENYITVKKSSLPIDMASVTYFKDLNMEENNSDPNLITILMIHHLLIKGLHKKKKLKTLYRIQKAIKAIDPKYLENKYLTMYSQKEIKQLNYLKKRLFFLIK